MTSQQRRRLARKAFLDAYKADKGCDVCGESDPRCLDFHHDDPKEKSFLVSQEYKKNSCRNWQLVLDEIEKCTVLCANCHRKRHDEELR